MSLFSKLFTRKITYIEWMGRDLVYSDILHVFGAIRVMPDEGDSFDIYRHSVIDLNTYQVINGLQQQGTEFSVNSEFAKRCIAHMSTKLNRQLKHVEAIETKEGYGGDEYDENDEVEYDQPEEDIEEVEYSESESESDSFEENCEMAVVDRDSIESDTGEAKKLPKTGLIFTKNTTGENERFILCLRKSGRDVAEHQMSGMGDYFRHVIYLKPTNRIVITYRKEGFFGMSGGMAFCVLDATTGDLLHNDFIK